MRQRVHEGSDRSHLEAAYDLALAASRIGRVQAAVRQLRATDAALDADLRRFDLVMKVYGGARDEETLVGLVDALRWQLRGAVKRLLVQEAESSGCSLAQVKRTHLMSGIPLALAKMDQPQRIRIGRERWLFSDDGRIRNDVRPRTDLSAMGFVWWLHKEVIKEAKASVLDNPVAQSDSATRSNTMALPNDIPDHTWSALSPQERRLVELRADNPDLTRREAATRLDTTPDAIRSAATRIRQKLRTFH